MPVLVITAAHSRFITGRMIPTRKTEDLLLGSWELIRQLGRVPRRWLWDNEPGIGRGQRRAEGVTAFMGTLATTLVLLPPRDPESKGIVERRNGWFETSFMPGRTFTSPADFNTQFGDWLVKDVDGIVIYRNSAAERLYGWTAQERWGSPSSTSFRLAVARTGQTASLTE